MKPAFSVVFLTTLCGAGQGLLIALFGVECASRAGWIAPPPTLFLASGAIFAGLLGVLGLVASFFHLGHPERAWRAIAMWRTSWLSRECLCLPLFIASAFAYGGAHALALPFALAIGAFGVIASGALFVCTSMIYACLRFLQEWATPLTMLNFTLLGCASGFTVAAAAAAWLAPDLLTGLAACAWGLTLAGCAGRVAALSRNARLRPKSTLQSATGLHAKQVVQISRGFTASAFNLREFFHGRSPQALRRLKWTFLVGAFGAPAVLIACGGSAGSGAQALALLLAASLVQFGGLVVERWYFFADARHPQNLYYQKAA